MNRITRSHRGFFKTSSRSFSAIGGLPRDDIVAHELYIVKYLLNNIARRVKYNQLRLLALWAM
jgi:hypothetical protein